MFCETGRLVESVSEPAWIREVGWARKTRSIDEYRRRVGTPRSPRRTAELGTSSSGEPQQANRRAGPSQLDQGNMRQGWARTTTAVSKLALLQGWVFLLVCLGQEIRLEDVPRGGIGPETVQRLPLNAALRTNLEEAFRSRDYTRAEALLLEEIGRNPQSFALLTLMGRILFLGGKYSECMVAMKKVQTLAPLSNHDRFTLSLAYIILRENELVRPELEELARVAPRDPRYPY